MVAKATPSTGISLARLARSYALLRVAGAAGLQRLTLPVTIGSDGGCDIVVHGAALRPLHYVLTEVPAEARGSAGVETPEGPHCQTPGGVQTVPWAALEPLGITILGQISGTSPTRPGFKNRWREALLIERHLYGRWPEALRKFSGHRLSQGKRWASWAAAAALAFGLLTFGTQDGSRPNYASTPLELQFDVPRSAIVGASPVRFGYEAGILFHFEAPAGIETQATLLTFHTMALDRPEELTIEVNEHEVHVTDLDPACIEQECVKHIPVAPGIVKTGANSLRFKHVEAAGSYMVKLVHIQPLPELSTLEKATVERSLRVARRFYDERGIVSDNLLTARQHVVKAMDLLQRRTGGEALLIEAKVLFGEIEAAFAAIVKETLADVQLHERLGRFDAMERGLLLLMRLFPDPSSLEHRTAKGKLQEIQEARL